jgi:hypothetical protein
MRQPTLDFRIDDRFHLHVQFDEFDAIIHEGYRWILVLRLASSTGPKWSHSLEQSVTYRKIKGTPEIMIIWTTVQAILTSIERHNTPYC